MSRFLEFHVIQNFAPSNLNRDDAGAPKDAIFGGQRRARVSSQCFKRAIRLTTSEHDLLPQPHRGVRTKKLKALLLERLKNRRDVEEAGAKIEVGLAAAGLKVKDDGKTEYLLFLGEREIDAFAELIDQHWDELTIRGDEKSDTDAKESKKDTKERKKAKERRKDNKAGIAPEVVKKAKSLLDGGKAVDIALFGRMLADLPAVNQDAACQVAHAISTHRVEREFDYFTAIDDKGDEDETGAGMIGHVEFNSATLYRYAVLDLNKLLQNLQGDRELALAAVEAFTQAMVRAIPSGKQNSFAAHNAPEFIGLCLRHTSPLNLANAFEKPVAYESRLAKVYAGPADRWASVDLTGLWPADKGEQSASLDALARKARELTAAGWEA